MVDDDTLKAWYFREIFPLEAALTRYIRRNWRNESDVADLRQEIYAKIYASAREKLPVQPKAYLFTIARNHLINSARHAQVVSIEFVAELEDSGDFIDNISPDRNLLAREELRHFHEGLRRLPPRCRQVVTLRKLEGLSTREVAKRLNIGAHTVEQQMVHGMKALINYMLGGSAKIKRGVSERPKVADVVRRTGEV